MFLCIFLPIAHTFIQDNPQLNFMVAYYVNEEKVTVIYLT